MWDVLPHTKPISFCLKHTITSSHPNWLLYNLITAYRNLKLMHFSHWTHKSIIPFIIFQLMSVPVPSIYIYICLLMNNCWKFLLVLQNYCSTLVFQPDEADFLMKFMRPFVDESWDVTGFLSESSGSMAFASCLPSSTLKEKQIH